MSMDLTAKTYRYVPDRFEAGIGPVAKAVKEAAEEIPAHAPVLLNGEGKLALLTAPEEEGSLDTQGLYGLAPDAIKAGEEGPVWLTGEYFADSLVLPEGVDAADVEVALRNIGIFLR